MLAASQPVSGRMGSFRSPFLQSMVSSSGMEEVYFSTEPSYQLHIMRKQHHLTSKNTAQEAFLKQKEIPFSCLM